RRFFYFRADLRWNAHQPTAHNVFAQLVQVFGNIRDQFVRSRMLALYLLEDLDRRLVRVDLVRGHGELFMFGFQLRHADPKNFLRRKINQLRLRQEACEFFFAKGELECGFGKFLPFEPARVITQRCCRFSIGRLKCNAELLVLEPAHGRNEISFQEIGRTSGDLDRKLDERFWQFFIEVRSRRDEYVWNLRFDGDQAANAVLKRRKVPFDVNVHVARARVNHRISFKDRHVLHFKQVALDRCLQNSKVDRLPCTQFRWIEFGQAIIETPEPGKFRVECEAAVIADFAVIFVKTESGSLERMSGEVSLYVFLGYRFVFGVLRLRSESRADERKRKEANEKWETADTSL